MPQFALPAVLAIVAVIALPLCTNAADRLLAPPIGISLPHYLRSLARDFRRQIAQIFLTLSLLPFSTYLMLHAISVTLYRLLISKVVKTKKF